MSFDTVPIGMVFRVVNGATPKSGDEELWDGDIPWVTPADLGKNDSAEIASGSRSITRRGLDSCGTQIVPAGSIVLSIRAPIGHTAIATEPMCFNQGCRALVPTKKVLTKFGYWAIISAKPALQSAGQGTTFQELGRDKLRAVKIPLPGLETQRQIADFLDRETARIDLLIEKREKFAALVAEARDSLVARMICGEGSETLDTTRNDWTDARPENWKSERAKVHFRERIEKSVDGSEELLTVSHITGVTTRAEKEVNMFLAESNEGYKIVHPGDIVINTMWGWMGAMGVSSHHGIISPSYGVYRPTSDTLEREYLDLMLRSKPFVAEVTRRSKGIHSSRLRIYPDAFLDMRLPMPPRDEQVAILAELRRRTERENALLAKNEQASALLKEYRSALITAAVTGQIDIQTATRFGAPDRRLDAVQEEMGA